MHALIVLAHLRPASLTAAVAARAQQQLHADGFTVDFVDLYGEGFDPVLRAADEPDWADAAKVYSPDARAHMDRLRAADAVVVVFPVWWSGLPAILKGWIDRIWNRGFAYEPSTLGGKHVLWLGLAAESEADFVAQGIGNLFDLQLRVGVSQYCGISDAQVRIVHDTLTAPDVAAADSDIAALSARVHQTALAT